MGTVTGTFTEVLMSKKSPNPMAMLIKEWSYSLRDHLTQLNYRAPLQSCQEALCRTVTGKTFNELSYPQSGNPTTGLSFKYRD